MEIKFKEQLTGERIILKRTRPSKELAKIMFKVIDGNRDHLSNMPWCAQTKVEKDTMDYLTEKEEWENKGKKVEFGIYIDEEYAGNISIFDLDFEVKSGEIGYWIAKKFTRNGYMTEAVKLLEKEFFESFGLNRIEIKCEPDNVASSGLIKKCGYAYEGELRENMKNPDGTYRNTLLFSKLRKEYNKK